MSISTSIPKLAGLRQSPHLAAIAAVISVIALFAGAGIATRAIESGTRPARASVPNQTSVLGSLTPHERQYVLGILSLTAQERRYVLGILSLTPVQLWAAFGTSPTPPAPRGGGRTPAPLAATGPTLAAPILPACGPGFCWRGAAGAGQSARRGA
jgi:hypothetical protein